MANEMKKVAEVFREFDERNNIMKSRIANITMSKKTGELTIFLQSEVKIQNGEILAFEMYLKDKFRVTKATINIDYVAEKTKEEKKIKVEKSKEEPKKEEIPEEVSPIIVGTKRSRINEKMIKVKDITADSGKVAISGKITRTEERTVNPKLHKIRRNINHPILLFISHTIA